jgi:hypothetical protein
MQKYSRHIGYITTEMRPSPSILNTNQCLLVLGSPLAVAQSFMDFANCRTSVLRTVAELLEGKPHSSLKFPKLY